MAAPQPPPGYLEPDTAQPPPGYIDPDQSMSWGDIARWGTTAGVRGLGGLTNAAWDPYGTLMAPFRTMISPEEEKNYQAGEAPGPGTKLGDAFFRATGIPEYQPITAPGRVAMSTAQGGIAGAPFGGVGALIGALSGGAGQTTQELTGNERLAAAASLLPGGALTAYGAVRGAPSPAAVPTAPELRDAGSAGFNATRASPVEIARAPLHGPLASALADVYQRYDPEMMPQTQRVIQNKIMQGGDLNFNDIINLRERLNQVIKDNTSTIPGMGNEHEVAGAQAILRQLDNHVASLGDNPQNITAGTPEQAAETAQTYDDARANYAAAMRSNKIGGGLRDEGTGGSIMGAAQNRVEAANSGWNYDNILRSQVRQFMEKDSNLRGFNPAEQDALNAARQGSFARNRLREIANLFGGGGGLGAAFTGSMGGGAGMAALGPFGVLAAPILPALGMGAKAIQNALARRSINAVDEMTRMRSPLYQDRVQNLPPLQPRDLATLQILLPGLLAPPPQAVAGQGLLNP